MTNYQISGAFHRASKTIIRAIKLSHPNSYECTKDAAGYIKTPTLMPGDHYVQLAGISNCQITVEDNTQEFRLIGDDGWSEGCISGAKARAAVTSYFMRDLQFLDAYSLGTGGATPAGDEYQNAGIACYLPAETSGPWERGFKIIKEARQSKDIGRIGSTLAARNNRVYVEILKELGKQSAGVNSPLVYDFLAFECNVLNYSERDGAEGLTEVSYELGSVGEVYVGQYLSDGPVKFSDDWTYSDFRDEITKESICRFGPEYTAIQANTTPSAGVLNVRYNHITGEAWLMMSGLAHIGAGRTVRLYALTFGCFSSDYYNSAYFPRPGDDTDFEVLEVIDRDVREYEIKKATYNNTTGVATLELEMNATIAVGDFIGVKDMSFTRLVDGQPIKDLLPEETAHTMVQVLSINGLTITVDLGAREDAYTYAGGGRIELGPVMKLNVGTAPMEHYYINGGSATVVGPMELNGEISTAAGATLSYNNADVQPRETAVLALP
jgi:hypothetical protein